MKKLMTVLLSITLLLTFLVGGALSYMTADAENLDNTITTGSMCLGSDPEPFMQLSGMMPGGQAQEATVTVFTNVPTKFFYKVQAIRQTGTSTKLWNATMVEVKDSKTGEVWSGHLAALSTNWFARVSGVDGGGIANGRQVSFKVWLPQEADVDEETTATVKFKFYAEQWRPVAN